MSDSIQYFILKGEQEEGPYTLGQLRSMWSTGSITSKTVYATPGMNEWRPLEDILELLEPSEQVKVSPPAAEKVLREPETKPSSAGTTAAKGCGVGCLVILALMIIIPMIAMMFESPSQKQNREADDMKFDAYYTAQKFVEQQYPGARGFADYKNSFVEKEGNIYRVVFQVDGLNAFGGPVRKNMIVEMRLDGKTWKHIATHQQ